MITSPQILIPRVQNVHHNVTPVNIPQITAHHALPHYTYITTPPYPYLPVYLFNNATVFPLYMQTDIPHSVLNV